MSGQPDIVVGAGGIEGALKRLRKIHVGIRRDTKKHRFFVKPSEVRRLMKKRGRAKWLKRRAAIERRLRCDD